MNKKIFLSIILIVCIVLIGSIVQADSTNNTSSFNARITANQTEVKPGEEVTVTLSIYNIDMGNYGINTVETTIEYDKNIFEEVKDENIKSLNNWLVPMFDNNIMLYYNKEKISALSTKQEQYWNKIASADFLSNDEKKELLDL